MDDNNIQRVRGGQSRTRSEQQQVWITWYERHFEQVLEQARARPVTGTPDEAVQQLASLEILESVCRYVNNAIYIQMVPWYVNSDGELNVSFDCHGGNISRDLTAANTNGGQEAARKLKSLLEPYYADGLPDNIRITFSRYKTPMSAPARDQDKYGNDYRLDWFEFDYRIIIPFPD